jgi:hypothetical protein
MSRLALFEIYLGNLKQEIPKEMRRQDATREQAYEALKRATGQDFGYDAKAWEQWLKQNKKL